MMIPINTPAVMIETILLSGICLNPVWAHAFTIAKAAEKLPASLRGRSVVPSTVAPALEAAYRRAMEVLASNARRRASLKASGHVW